MNINNILRKANFRMTMASAPFPVSLHKDIAVVPCWYIQPALME